MSKAADVKVARIITHLAEVAEYVETQRRRLYSLQNQYAEMGFDTAIIAGIVSDLRRGKLPSEIDLNALYLARLQEKRLSLNQIEAPEHGFVYFIRFDRTKRLKIGYTTKLGARLKTIENAGGERGELCALLLGTLALEQRAHHSFRQWRLKGEWFDYTPECAAHVERFRTEYGPSSDTLQGKLIASVVGSA